MGSRFVGSQCRECEEEVPCRCDEEWVRMAFHPSRAVVDLRPEVGNILLLPTAAADVRRQLFAGEATSGEVEIELRRRVPPAAQNVPRHLAGLTRYGLVLAADEAWEGGRLRPGRRVLIPWPEVVEVRAAHER
jgi:hypothetical protein